MPTGILDVLPNIILKESTTFELLNTDYKDKSRSNGGIVRTERLPRSAAVGEDSTRDLPILLIDRRCKNRTPTRIGVDERGAN